MEQDTTTEEAPALPAVKLPLVERAAKDLAALHAHNQKIREVNENEKARIVKHAETLKAMEKERYRLGLAVKESAEAARDLEAHVPLALRRAADNAGSERRKAVEAEKEAQATFRDQTEATKRAHASDADKTAKQASDRKLDEATLALAQAVTAKDKATKAQDAAIAAVTASREAARKALSAGAASE